MSRTLDSLIGIVSQMEQGLSALQQKANDPNANNPDLEKLRSAMKQLTEKVQKIQVIPFQGIYYEL